MPRLKGNNMTPATLTFTVIIYADDASLLHSSYRDVLLRKKYIKVKAFKH